MEEERNDRKRRRRSKVKPAVSWTAVDAGVIADFVILLEKLDGAVRFGRSRDRAVYSIGFYVGEERWTEWLKADDDIAMELARVYDEIVEDFGPTSDDNGQTA